MKAAVEHHFTGTTEPLTGTYDSSKTMIASLLRQATGAGVEDKFISTKPSAIFNYPEIASAAGGQQFPHVYKWSNNIYWIFAVASSGNTTTKTITMSEFDASTSTLTYRGFVTLQGTTVANTKNQRSLRAFVYEHTTGTVSTSGSSTTITGSGTGFQSERIAVGARIGFGTTDPTAVTTWYDITAIASDSSLTITSPVSLAGGTSYVIEEIRIAVPVIGQSIVVNGGIHLIKGLNPSAFIPLGNNIPEAATTDNIRASYLLKDAAIAGAGTATFTVTIATPGVFTCVGHGLQNGDVVCFTTTGALPTGLSASPTTTLTYYYVINRATDTFQVSTTLNGSAVATSGTQSGTHTLHHAPSMVAAGLAADDFTSNTQHDLYLVCNPSSLNVTIIKYNMRASLSLGAYAAITTGVSTSAYVHKTSTQSLTTAIPATNGSRIFTVNHGPASGVKSLYFPVVNRIYRCAVSALTSNSTNYISDAGMTEVPPGAAVTFSLTAAMAQVDYSSTIDRLFITTSTGRLGTYVAQYTTDGTQFEKTVGANLTRLKLTTTPSGASDGLFPQATLSIWTEDGWMFAIPSSTTTGINWLYVFPFGADAYYNSTSNQHIITPKLATPNATKLYHAYVDHQEYAGSYGLGFPVETYRMWYRTSGIDDNSGAWTEVPVGADLQSAAPGDYIQFKIAFDILGEICVPTRIFSVCCVYEDDSQDSHYQPSLTYSSAANRRFAWKQVQSWGGTGGIPDLQLRLYNAATEFLVLDDTVGLSGSGDWEYSSNNGSTWAGWSAGADAIGNYIRYTADSLPNNITVRALLTQV